MADPLDGLGQPFHKKAMRWKRMLLKEEALINGSKAFATLMIFRHAEEGCCSARDCWASSIDAKFSKKILCGYID